MFSFHYNTYPPVCQASEQTFLLIYNRFVKKQAYFYFVRDLSPEKVGLLQQTHFYL